MPALISSLDHASATWMTEALRQAGAIGHAEVTALQRQENAAFNSSIAHFRLAYSAGAPAAAPQRVLLKLNANQDGMAEVAFYQLAATLPAPLPMLARCYWAAYDPQSGDSLLLLEDYSATHATPVTRAQVLALEGMPSDRQLDQMVDALASFHAAWWQHPRLGRIPELTELRWWYRDQAHFERHVERRAGEWARFIADTGSWFPADLRALYEDALARMPLLWQPRLAARAASFANLTMSNGDCYFNQFLCPLDEAEGHAYIVDFQDASANFGPFDLVYMFATFWTPEQRRAGGREERLLRRYHEGLRAHSVAGYSWEALLDDYRLMLIFELFDPIWNQTSGSPQSYWWPKLQCLASAFQDWRCADLLSA